MPERIDRVFATAGSPLFPVRREFDGLYVP